MWEIDWLVRAAHILAATVWVGGSCMYVLVVLPALRIAGPAPAVAAQVAILFKRLVNYCIGILMVTGVYLTLDRLTQTTSGLAYIVVLIVKILCALGLFLLAFYLGQSNVRRLAKRTTRFSRVAPQLMLALGILVFVLGALLNALFALSLAPH